MCLSEKDKNQVGESIILMGIVIMLITKYHSGISNQGGDMHGERGIHGVEKKYTHSFEREAKGKGRTLTLRRLM